MSDVLIRPTVLILFVCDVPVSAGFFKEKLGFEEFRQQGVEFAQTPAKQD